MLYVYTQVRLTEDCTYLYKQHVQQHYVQGHS